MFIAIANGQTVTFRVVITLEKDAHCDAATGTYTSGNKIQEVKAPPVTYSNGGASDTNGESGHQDRTGEAEETDEDGNPIPKPAPASLQGAFPEPSEDPRALRRPGTHGRSRPRRRSRAH